MNPFRIAYDWIKSRKTPAWLKTILGEIQDIIKRVLIQVGQNYIAQLQAKIIEVSKKDIPGEEKFGVVFAYARQLGINLKDSALNTLIEALYQKVKAEITNE